MKDAHTYDGLNTSGRDYDKERGSDSMVFFRMECPRYDGFVKIYTCHEFTNEEDQGRRTRRTEWGWWASRDIPDITTIVSKTQVGFGPVFRKFPLYRFPHRRDTVHRNHQSTPEPVAKKCKTSVTIRVGMGLKGEYERLTDVSRGRPLVSSMVTVPLSGNEQGNIPS